MLTLLCPLRLCVRSLHMRAGPRSMFPSRVCLQVEVVHTASSAELTRDSGCWATPQATCLLAAPPALWQRVTLAAQAASRRGPAGDAPPAPPAPSGAGGGQAGGKRDPGPDPAGAAGGVLVHVRFSFDRTPLRRMHAALAHAAHTSDNAVRLLPVRTNLFVYCSHRAAECEPA